MNMCTHSHTHNVERHKGTKNKFKTLKIPLMIYICNLSISSLCSYLFFLKYSGFLPYILPNYLFLLPKIKSRTFS